MNSAACKSAGAIGDRAGSTHVATFKSCPQCGNAFRTKGHYKSTLRSVYGKIDMRIRRLKACPCSGSRARSFSTLFTNKSPLTPDLRYLTAKMAVLLPFRKAADFLGEFLHLLIAWCSSLTSTMSLLFIGTVSSTVPLAPLRTTLSVSGRSRVSSLR